MRFALPSLLWLLLLVPLLAVFLVWAWRTKQRLIAQFVQSRLLAQLTVGVSKTRQKVRLALLVGAVACAVLALARPQWGFSWEEVSQKGLDIVVAIDTSRSMLAADIPPNRLERAKLAALDLMKLARNDRLGLVAFAGSAFLQCPLTLDEEAFRQGVAALDVNIIPQGGTAIAETIQTALAAFKDGDNHKVLVLFTDGEDHEAGVLEAAQSAGAKGLRIFTIGVGSAAGELIRVPDAKGKLDFLKDESGNVVKSRLNETLLQQIAGAAASGGFYLPLRGANTMDLLYERGLAPLPKSEFNQK
ncbi:MAG: VWA domain-containing protein, partial [Limisphaerales bacterium]